MDQKTDASIEALYREAFPVVARIVAKMGGDLNSARDIFHDALIIYIEKERMQTLGTIVSAKAYVTGIARILWIRKYNRDVMHIPMAGAEEHIADAQVNDRLQDMLPEALLASMESAGIKCLEILQAFYYEQSSMQEISERFKYKTTRSATVQKYKCLEKVREQLKSSAIYEEAIA